MSSSADNLVSHLLFSRDTSGVVLIDDTFQQEALSVDVILQAVTVKWPQK